MRGRIEDRFWAKVDKSGECWLWTARVDRSGYGRFRFSSSKVERAHRVAWRIENGPISAIGGYHGACVIHLCDNRRCVRPEHLAIGSQGDNIRDMDSKRRRPLSKFALGVLTDIDVRLIRSTYAIGGVSQFGLGRLFGVSKNTVSNIVRGLSGRHIE